MYLFINSCLLFFACSYRTSAGAGSTVDALIFVDHVYSISLGNSFCRTFIDAGAAAQACVSNFISHL